MLFEQRLFLELEDTVLELVCLVSSPLLWECSVSSLWCVLGVPPAELNDRYGDSNEILGFSNKVVWELLSTNYGTFCTDLYFSNLTGKVPILSISSILEQISSKRDAMSSTFLLSCSSESPLCCSGRSYRRTSKLFTYESLRSSFWWKSRTMLASGCAAKLFCNSESTSATKMRISADVVAY